MRTDPEDIAKEHRDHRINGSPVLGKSRCGCGALYWPFTGDDNASDGCSECRWNRYRGEQKERVAFQKLREHLLCTPRPRLGFEHRALWVEVRRGIRKPARVRNRCWCGGRVSERLLQMCADCALSHRKNLIWDAVFHLADAERAEAIANRYGLGDFLSTLITTGPDRLTPWKERSIQISGGAAAEISSRAAFTSEEA